MMSLIPAVIAVILHAILALSERNLLGVRDYKVVCQTLTLGLEPERRGKEDGMPMRRSYRRERGVFTIRYGGKGRELVLHAYRKR